MRHPYDELLRQMEQEALSSSELFWRFWHAVTPEKFWEPPVDVYETRDALKIRVEIGGTGRDDIHVELAADGKSVTIRGLRLDGAPDACDRTTFHQMEIYTGPFERIVALPPNVPIEPSEIEAQRQDGFLVITLPKRRKSRPATRRIRVQG